MAAIAMSKRVVCVLFGRPQQHQYQRQAVRALSTDLTDRHRRDRPSSKYIKSVTDSEIRKSVFISQSYDVFTNLALEDWLYRNFDFTHHHILMLWANDPCVVVGRHQNPFNEASVSQLERMGVQLARRNSGGGTVYHDRGNLNCTFFTPRERYDRKYNLQLITRAIYREFGIATDLGDRDDILMAGRKISGTAAKLGQPNAYHHCTLLVNSDREKLKEALQRSQDVQIIHKATASIPSPVKNLAEANRTCTVAGLLSAIGYEFLRTPASALEDGGRDLVMKQRGFQLVNPTEKWFPGLGELREQFASWDWRFGRTPKFSVLKAVRLKSEAGEHDVQVKVDVEKALIEDISLILPNAEEPIPVVSALRGQPYSEDIFEGIVSALKGASTENVKHAIGIQH